MDVTVALRPKTGELRPQKNPPGFSGTRDNALEYDPDDYTLVNIRTESVQYGKYAGQPAALIILRFIVRFRPGNKRLRSFHVSIEFSHPAPDSETGSDGVAAGGIQAQPKVLAFAPEDCRGSLFTEERDTAVSLGLGMPLGVPGLSADWPDAGVTVERSSKIVKEREMRLSGWRRSSANAVDNIVVWDCVEAKKVAKGVLPNFRAVMVVGHREHTPFRAVLKLDVERGLWNSASKLFDWMPLFGKREDDPLLFDPSQPVGRPVASDDFTELDLDDLIKLQPIPTLPSGYN